MFSTHTDLQGLKFAQHKVSIRVCVRPRPRPCVRAFVFANGERNR